MHIDTHIHRLKHAYLRIYMCIHVIGCAYLGLYPHILWFIYRYGISIVLEYAEALLNIEFFNIYILYLSFHLYFSELIIKKVNNEPVLLKYISQVNKEFWMCLILNTLC